MKISILLTVAAAMTAGCAMGGPLPRNEKEFRANKPKDSHWRNEVLQSDQPFAKVKAGITDLMNSCYSGTTNMAVGLNQGTVNAVTSQYSFSYHTRWKNSRPGYETLEIRSSSNPPYKYSPKGGAWVLLADFKPNAGGTRVDMTYYKTSGFQAPEGIRTVLDGKEGRCPN